MMFGEVTVVALCLGRVGGVMLAGGSLTGGGFDVGTRALVKAVVMVGEIMLVGGSLAGGGFDAGLRALGKTVAMVCVWLFTGGVLVGGGGILGTVGMAIVGEMMVRGAGSVEEDAPLPDLGDGYRAAAPM